MKSLKRFLFMIALSSVLLLVTACGSSDDVSDNKSEEDEKSSSSSQVIRVSHQDASDTSTSRAFDKFKEIVEEKTNGEVEVEIYPNGQLGTLRESTEQVQGGTIEVTEADMTTLSSFVDSTGVLALPFLLPTENDELWELLHGEVWNTLQGHMHENKMHMLGYFGLGYKAFTNSEKPIHSPEDIKGLKVRIIPSKVMELQYETWGASPIPVDYGELYTSLQTGVVEAQENPLESIEATSLYEVQKYMTLMNHTNLIMGVVVNKDWFDSLEPELQEIVTEAGEEATAMQREITEEESAELMEFLAEHLEINELTDEEVEEFRDVTVPIYDELVETDQEKELLEVIQSH